MHHLQAKHGQFLHGKQEFLAIHLQQLTVARGYGSAEAAMLWIHQCSDTKRAPWSDHLNAMITPIELNLSRYNTVEAVSKFPVFKNNVALFHGNESAFAGQCRHGIQLKIFVDVHNEMGVGLK